MKIQLPTTKLNVQLKPKFNQKRTSKKMKVVILAGGKGSRISEITKRIPKPMIQIKNRTILEHIINIYSEQNFNEFIIAIGYKGELIKKYFKKYEIKKNQYQLKGHNKIIRINKNSNIIIIDF